MAIQAGLLAALVVAPQGSTWATGPGSTVVGIVLAGAGAGLLAWSAVTLGRGLTPHPAPSSLGALRTSGPFRLVRHPTYSAVVLFAVKARFEERLLRGEYRDYDAYAQQTPRFIPRFHSR